MELGYHDVRIAGEVVANARRRSRLAGEVELERDELGELVGERSQIEPAVEPARDADGTAQRREIDREQPAGLGILDLDDDVAAVAQARTVDLGQRRRRERLDVDRLEHLGDRPAELALDVTREPGELPRRN